MRMVWGDKLALCTPVNSVSFSGFAFLSKESRVVLTEAGLDVLLFSWESSLEIKIVNCLYWGRLLLWMKLAEEVLRF